jgi:dolichol-phosphate mannosyltransferase
MFKFGDSVKNNELKRVELGGFSTYIQFFYTFGRFLGVGLSGVGVNLLVLWLLVFIQPALLPLVAAVLATEVSIIWNFLLHDFWTFKPKEVPSRPGSKKRLFIFSRFIRFQLISAVGAVLSLCLFWLFNTGWHFYYLLAQLFAIGLTTLFNFFFNAYFTWGWFGRTQAEEVFSESAS